MRGLLKSTFAFIASGLFVAAPLRAAEPASPEEPAEVPAQVDESGPASAIWMGGRLGIFAPYGALYSGRDLVTTGFQSVAASGPAAELEVGGRLTPHFFAYGFSGFASLGPGLGTPWEELHGAQMSASTEVAGVGVRWLANPRGLGLALDFGVGYRWFTANWADGTTMRLSGLGDVRFGAGAAIAATRGVSLQPMLTIYTGVFGDRTLGGQSVGSSGGSYAATLLSLGGTFDLLNP